MTERRWRSVGTAVFALSTLLLVSYGGAIVAAPVTVPLVVLAVRHRPTRAFRALGSALVALTTAEVAWAFTYVALGEAKPWIWITPLLVGVTAGCATARSAARQPTTIGTLA